MDKAIIGVLLIAIIAIVSATSLAYYVAIQTNETHNTPLPTPTPASTPLSTPAPTAEPTLTNDYVVYEWHLKAEYVNNVTWLNSTIRSTTAEYYDSDKTWTENYIAYIDGFWAIPKQIADAPEMGVLAKAAFVIQVSASVSFNEATGFTEVVYQYAESGGEPLYYVIESSLTNLADDRGWTKTFI